MIPLVRQIPRLRIALLVLATAGSALLLASYWLGWCDGRTALEWALGANSVIVLIYVSVSYVHYTRRTPSYPTPHVSQMDVERLIESIEGAGDFSTAVAGFYLQMVVDPSRYVVRASDRIEPTSRAYNLTRGQTIAIPPGLGNAKLPLPIDYVSKKSLVNSLRVSINDGARLSTLSQAATIAHSVLVVDTLVNSLSTRIRNGYLDVRPTMMQFLCEPNVVEGVSPAYTESVDALSKLGRNRQERLKIASLVGFLHILVNHYPLVVYVDIDRHTSTTWELAGSRVVRVTIERRVLPLVGAGLTRFIRLQERVRGWLGVQSARVVWPLSNAMRARSYHVECLGPAGTYLANQRILTVDGGDTGVAEVPNCKLLGRYGQRYAHLYVNDFRPSATTDLGSAKARTFFVASFFERPPGTIAVATFAAWVSLAFILVAAGSKLGTVHDLNTDVVSVMLTLPTLAIAWIGIGGASAPGRSVFTGSLVARALLLATFIVNVYAATVFVLTDSVSTSGPMPPLSERMHFLPWSVAAAVAGWLALAGSASWFLRVATYRYFLERPSPEARADGLQWLGR